MEEIKHRKWLDILAIINNDYEEQWTAGNELLDMSRPQHTEQCSDFQDTSIGLKSATDWLFVW